MTCRGCNETIRPGERAAEMAPYWGPHSVDGVAVRFPVHKACKAEAVRAEAYECQVIDADCNDCRHFERDTSFVRQKGHRPPSLPGHCLKFDRPTKAQPNTCTMHPCFEHRRAPAAYEGPLNRLRPSQPSRPMIETPDTPNGADADALVRPAAAGSAAPSPGERNRTGWEFERYADLYGRYLEDYDTDQEPDAEGWWRLGTEPSVAARHTANAVRAWD